LTGRRRDLPVPADAPRGDGVHDFDPRVTEEAFTCAAHACRMFLAEVAALQVPEVFVEDGPGLGAQRDPGAAGDRAGMHSADVGLEVFERERRAVRAGPAADVGPAPALGAVAEEEPAGAVQVAPKSPLHLAEAAPAVGPDVSHQ